MERKIGTVYSTNPKGWIFLYVTPAERYFAHITQLAAFPALPLAGQRVSFVPGPPFNDGKLPCANDVQPIVDGVAQ